mmetsp:Transcript_7916/g.13284  ORF Transcript_7916/g.13284 Transcript_7916/m.13284 type:complete len:176 (+) Transcript_7916:124-651(+)|eukprot:CAMPEP_0168611380 /NCGR_PEP_ID=MMETSP0449_2-20121227/2328_1 /TAXON_ID=1082188 /ORGANISM="Strombidium rassoulzadegani, Strain ras09" /LENGTH=175 /DNA_ID=CAMNT_0008651825 /DNA_START=45 /DNA_END=572 /DNA_ORIENTATION=-
MSDSVTLVTEDDEVVGPTSKVEAHLLSNLRHKKSPFPPHRAFSLFLFNAKNELLLQQRSGAKVTFPGLWTNTCCSHPRHEPSELEVDVGRGEYIGIQRAVSRRTAFELGINESEMQVAGAENEREALSGFHVGSRILYYAEDGGKKEVEGGATGEKPVFAEYELDYIVFAKMEDP